MRLLRAARQPSSSMTEQVRAGVEAHGGGPASLDGGAGGSGGQVGGGGEVGAVAGMEQRPGPTDLEDGFAGAGWADEQDVGRRFQVAAGAQLVDQSLRSIPAAASTSENHRGRPGGHAGNRRRPANRRAVCWRRPRRIASAVPGRSVSDRPLGGGLIKHAGGRASAAAAV